MLIVATVIFIVAFLTFAITVPIAWRQANRGKRRHDEVGRELLESSESYRKYHEVCSPCWE